MNEQEYLKAIEEMTIPALKINAWAEIIRQEHYHQYTSTDQELFERLLRAAQNLVDLIPKLQLTDSSRKLEVFTHILSGPIMSLRDNTLLLMKHKEIEVGQSEKEKEYVRYLKKINSAAEYLSSLDRDVVLKMMQDRIDREEKLPLKPEE
jgi:hypothetical protein